MPKVDYRVQAYDMWDEKIITFNRMLTPTYEEAIKFAKHLKKDLSNAYKDIKVITEKYELLERKEKEI